MSVLNAQIGSEERIATLKKLDSDNDKKAFGNAEQGRGVSGSTSGSGEQGAHWSRPGCISGEGSR